MSVLAVAPFGNISSGTKIINGAPESLENPLYFQFTPFDPENDSIFLEAVYLIFRIMSSLPLFSLSVVLTVRFVSLRGGV